MLTFITGQPGAGKTLYAVSHIDKKAHDEGRVVFYNRKKDPEDPESPGQLIIYPDKLKADWLPFDDYSGFRWQDAPEGAIIFLDECHRELFPMRKIGADVPSHVDAMSTHRHRGHDVFITCQHSTQCDTFIRKMAGEHHHFIRRFGTSVSTQYIWPEIANERDTWDRKKAQTKVFRYPKEYFGSYKSTVLNTVKPKLPWVRIGALAAGVLLVPLLIWVGAMAVWPDDEAPQANTSGSGEFTGPPAPALFGSGADDPLQNRPALYSPDTWMPEVDDIPYSAMFYDTQIQPQTFPKIAGCYRLQFGDGRDICKCSSQQGTDLRLSYRACVDIMEHGWFDFSQPDPPPPEYPEPDPYSWAPDVHQGGGQDSAGRESAAP